MRAFVRALRVLWLVVLSACVAVTPMDRVPPRPATVVSVPVVAAPSGAVQASSDRIPIEASNPVRGDPNAPVTLVAFLDLQCPYCARAERTVEQLRQRYGDRLRIVVKHFPLEFHALAMPSARVAQAVFRLAGPAAFFGFVGAVYDNQSSLSEDNLRIWAERVGVPPEVLEAELQRPEVDSEIRADIQLAGKLGITGTPEFRINGVAIDGAQPIETFTAVVDAEMDAADRLSRDGVPASDIYRRRVAAQPLVPEANSSSSEDEAPDTTVYRIPIDGSPVSGPTNAPITLVEFGDFQCPWCKRVQATLDEVIKRYPGKIRIVFKNNPLPFHPRAVPAAQLALEARAERGDEGFFDVAALLYAADDLEDADLLAIAKKAGLNMGRVRSALKKTSHPSIDRDQMLALDFKANGTPHFFVNGRRLAGAQPVERFAAVIEPELARVASLLDAGVLPSAVYDKILEQAQGPVPLERKEVPAATAANPSRGSKRAPVEVHEFADFQCPFCKRVLPTLKELERAYPGKLRLVWHNMPLPFHGQAELAATAAMEAYAQRGATGFWAMHDLLFEHQSDPDGLERASIEKYARRLGLDAKRFAVALDGSTHRAEIEADKSVASAVGISGTPAFVINGYFVSGAQPLLQFRRAVERALEDLKKPAARAKP